MLENGYIKLHRSLLSWEWYDDPNTLRVFLHLLLTVNHEPKKWHGRDINCGQRVCSLSKLALETKLSVQSVRTAIKHLKSTGELTHETTPEYSLFTVNNYNRYQELTSKPTGETTTNQQANNNQSANASQAANKGLTNGQQQRKNDKNDKKIDIGDSACAREPTRTFGEFGKVKLTQERYDALVQRLGKDSTEEYIARLDAYIASKGKQYDDHFATILSWWRKDAASEPRFPPKQPVTARTAGSSIDIDKLDAMIEARFCSMDDGSWNVPYQDPLWPRQGRA